MSAPVSAPLRSPPTAPRTTWTRPTQSASLSLAGVRARQWTSRVVGRHCLARRAHRRDLGQSGRGVCGGLVGRWSPRLVREAVALGGPRRTRSAVRRAGTLPEPAQSQRPEVGDPVDFWRVEAADPRRRLRFHAEMRRPGDAWLISELSPSGDDGTFVTQTAELRQRGFLGRF